MKANWIICDNHLALKDGNNIYHLSASEIYSFSDMNRIDGIECESPLVDLPATRFSKIGAAAKIMLTSSVSERRFDNSPIQTASTRSHHTTELILYKHLYLITNYILSAVLLMDSPYAQMND